MQREYVDIYQLLLKNMRNDRQEVGQNQVEQRPQEDNIFFSLIDKVGAVGRYQTSTFITLCVVGYLVGGITLMTPFLFYQDPYTCPPPATAKNCLHFVCKLPPAGREAYIPSVSIYSLSNKFGDYRCQSDQSQVTMIKTLMYSGALMGFVCCSLLGDLVGTKSLMLGGLLMNLVGLLKILLSQSLTSAGFGLFFSLFGLTVSAQVSFVFVTETVGQQKRMGYKVALASIYSLGGLLNVIWFYFIPNFETIMILFYFFPTILCTLAMIFIFKDTPITLISKRSPEQALKDLKMIARINKKVVFDLTLEDVKDLQRKYRQHYLQDQEVSRVKSFTVFDLFKYQSLRSRVLLFIILDCVLNLQYFTPTLILDQLNFSIFVSGFAIESAQLIAGALSFLLIYRCQRRRMAIFSFSIIAICSIILVFIWDQSGKTEPGFFSSLIVLLFIFTIEFAISNEFNFYLVYLNQTFPTQVRIISIGFIKTFGTLAVIFTPALITACANSGFPLMLVFAIMAVISVWCSYVLPETYGKKPAEVIEELREEQPQPVKIAKNDVL